MQKDEDDQEDAASIAIARYPCMPSLVALQQMKNRLHLAFVGKKLMKWTAQATGRELRKLARDLIQTCQYRQAYKDAFILLARARYFYPNLNKMVLEHIGHAANITVDVKTKSISGVKVLHMDLIDTGQDTYQHLGIEKGGQAILEAKQAWRQLLVRVIHCLEQREAFLLVDMAHRSATKKMNVLKRIIIPKIEHTIRYILTELEELEREDTFRLKRVKQNNMKRAKQKIKQDGAGERTEVIEPTKKEDKLETKSKSVAESVAAEKPERDKDSGNIDKELPVQPKEAAEMGDLIIIKAAEDTLELGDVLDPTGLINMGIVTETKEVIDQSALDEKEMKEKNEIENTVPDETQADENVMYDDLEAGEWFETANTTVNKPSEYSKMDKYEDVLGSKRLSDDNSIASVDLDKRGLESLFKGIDSNFYKPTIDDLFSKHDIAMQDEVSEYSLVDFESIDFSIDSKGKVIQSRHGSGQSSPAISHRGEDTKQHVKYSDGFIRRTSMERQSLGQAEESLQPTVENKVMAEDMDKITEPNVAMMIENDASDMKTGDLIEQRLDVDNVEEKIDNQDLQDSKLNGVEEDEDKDILEIQDAQDIEKISSTNPAASESELKQNIEEDNKRKIETRISRSISDEKLSRISEEENLEADKSKLSTVLEEPVEIRGNDVEGSIVSDKFHKNENLKVIDENEIDVDNSLIQKETPENTAVGTSIKQSPDENKEDDQQRHPSLTKDDKQEHFQPIKSARSSRDLRNINMKNMDQKPVLINQELPNTLNSIAEEEDASSDNNDRTVKEESMNIDNVKLQCTVQRVDNTDETKALNKGEDINTNYEENKHVNDLKDTTVNKSNDTLDVEEKPLRIRDSTEITKSKLDVKVNTGQDLKHIKEDTSIQLKRRSQVKPETENKPLTIKTSDESIESKEDNTQKYHKTDDNEKDKEQKEKTKKKDNVDRDKRSDDESSPSADKPERHSGDDHLKQD